MKKIKAYLSVGDTIKLYDEFLEITTMATNLIRNYRNYIDPSLISNYFKMLHHETTFPNNKHLKEIVSQMGRQIPSYVD